MVTEQIMNNATDNIILERIAEAEACSIISLIKRGEDVEEVSAFFDVTPSQIDKVLMGNYGVIIIPAGVFSQFVREDKTDSSVLLQVKNLWDSFMQEKGIEAGFLSKKELLPAFFSYAERGWLKLYDDRLRG